MRSEKRELIEVYKIQRVTAMNSPSSSNSFPQQPSTALPSFNLFSILKHQAPS
jgi:hypothetical protein